MLDRDKYEPDHCMTQFPNASFEEYVSYLVGPLTFRRLFTHNKDFEKEAELRNNSLFGVLVLSAMPVVFHKRIYWFRNYTSKKSRILMGLAWLLIPVNILGVYFQFDTNRELMVKYEMNKNLFQKMLEAGDINITNPYQ